MQRVTKERVKMLGIFMAVLASIFLVYMFINQEESSSGGITSQFIEGADKNVGVGSGASRGSFESILLQNEMIQKLPEKTIVMVRFYNFETGERAWEKSYIITSGKVEEGYLENVDLTMFVHSKYIPEITSENLCDVTKSAKANGDLGVETELSTLKLLYKFRTVTKYKSCLGL